MRAETLRIAFATQEYVTEKNFDGGIANYVHRVARALAELGHDVHVVTLSAIDQTEFEHEGVTVHRVAFGKLWHALNRLTRYRLATTYYALALSAKAYRKLKQLNAQQPFHIMQFPNCSCCGLFSILFLGVPHVLRASWYQPAWEAADGRKPSLDSMTMKLLERLQYSRSPYVYAPSYNLQRLLAKNTGLDSVRVIRTPIYLETEDRDDSIYNQFLKGRKYLLFFGRFELRKGFHILAQALPRVLAEHADAYAVLVGRNMKSALAESMADYARTLCADARERLLVFDEMPHSQLYPVIAGAHLVVLPSLIDNLPNACLEAMALGKAVIGTRGTSFDELITDEETGFVVAPDDVDALAEKINYAWRCTRLREIGQAAQQKSLEFSPEKTVETLLAYYREILQG